MHERKSQNCGCMKEADCKRCSNRGQARKAEGVGQLSRQEDRESTARQRKRSFGSSASASSCSITFWRLASGTTNHCSGTTNDERDHQERHWNETRHQHLRTSSLSLWEASGKCGHTRYLMSPQCCKDQSAQHGQRHRLESHKEGRQNSSSKGTTRSTTK